MLVTSGSRDERVMDWMLGHAERDRLIEISVVLQERSELRRASAELRRVGQRCHLRWLAE
jgi:hypothetical protein